MFRILTGLIEKINKNLNYDLILMFRMIKNKKNGSCKKPCDVIHRTNTKS